MYLWQENASVVRCSFLRTQRFYSYNSIYVGHMFVLRIRQFVSVCGTVVLCVSNSFTSAVVKVIREEILGILLADSGSSLRASVIGFSCVQYEIFAYMVVYCILCLCAQVAKWIILRLTPGEEYTCHRKGPSYEFIWPGRTLFFYLYPRRRNVPDSL